MFSEVTALEVLALVKKTHTPVSATSLPSVTNTLNFLVQPGFWATGWGGAGAAAAEVKIETTQSFTLLDSYYGTVSDTCSKAHTNCRTFVFGGIGMAHINHHQ